MVAEEEEGLLTAGAGRREARSGKGSESRSSEEGGTAAAAATGTRLLPERRGDAELVARAVNGTGGAASPLRQRWRGGGHGGGIGHGTFG